MKFVQPEKYKCLKEIECQICQQKSSITFATVKCNTCETAKSSYICMSATIYIYKYEKEES